MFHLKYTSISSHWSCNSVWQLRCSSMIVQSWCGHATSSPGGKGPTFPSNCKRSHESVLMRSLGVRVDIPFHVNGTRFISKMHRFTLSESIGKIRLIWSNLIWSDRNRLIPERSLPRFPLKATAFKEAYTNSVESNSSWTRGATFQKRGTGAETPNDVIEIWLKCTCTPPQKYRAALRKVMIRTKAIHPPRPDKVVRLSDANNIDTGGMRALGTKFRSTNNTEQKTTSLIT